ncbi:serine/arginine repetitive matrix protein 1 isoform X4 [Neltuma alba]|uniref:serine/arginine repetitive matrix protein 1 isoform X4 n=1 Tax=Neltuma alba TaxID=207710 RepID=UPI0010A54F41|nr:serine/arginine repetitive matrix protein 1-like isoform X4 [Prosopis alba]
MSGGFFRGTSADQDTRFSNKQAKLLKSQKFAPELDHLVDMTKVNMDVIKPWITIRVTELLGFEDEVLINFIHGLLDAKEVNGKEVQIQITGFMEKNTGKFMKELWSLLLSAQKNASGVPQQFLDAKEEELRKKKVENDKITSELQKKRDKEGREFLQERVKKMDGGFDAKGTDTASDQVLKPRDSVDYGQDGRETDKRNGVRSRNRYSRSPHSPAVSGSPNRDSPSRSMSRSFSNSRSYSGQRSRSTSRLPEARGRSLSSERTRHSPRRRSISPPRRHSPWRSPRRRSSYSRRRSTSRSHYRSPSLRRRVRSPLRHRSPSPVRRRRSPSPARRRRSPSPVRRRRSPSPLRSPSPVRRRRSPPPPMRRRRSPSPVRRRRSPSPVRRRRSPSPVRRRRSPSPLHHRRSPSPIQRRRSPSPIRKMSPRPVRQRSPSPMPSHSPVRRRYRSRTPQRRSPSPVMHRSPVSDRKWSPSPSSRRSLSSGDWSSKSPPGHASSSPVRRNAPRPARSPVQSSEGRVRTQDRLSPAAHQSSSPVRNVQRDKDRNSLHYKSQGSLSTPEKSPTMSLSPQARNKTFSEDSSPHESPRKQKGEMLTREGSLSPPQKSRIQKPRRDSPETSEGREGTYYSRESRDHKSTSSQRKMKYLSPDSKWKVSPAKTRTEDMYSPERAAGRPGSESQGRNDSIDLSKKGRETRSDKSSRRVAETPTQPKSRIYKESFSGEKLIESYDVDSKKSGEKYHSHSSFAKGSDKHGKSENAEVKQSVSCDSGSEESGRHRREGKDKRKHKRSERKVASDEESSYDSELENRKEAKRRKKEERKLRKEEKRRRREERRRRKEERRAEKLKMKSRTDGYTSDEEEAERKDFRRSDDEETPSDQKKLEIELRNKALESLKAKKGLNN